MVYRSNSLDHRLIVESALISLCHTVEGNKASAAKKDMNVLAPMILKGSPIIWKDLAKVDSCCLNPQVVPRKYRSFFSHRDREASIVASSPRTPDTMPRPSIADVPRPPEVNTSQPQEPHYNLRSLGLNDLTVPVAT